MKTLIAFALTLLATTASADSSACYSITNADARAECQARARQDSSQCYAIQDSQRRAECLALVRR